MEKTLPKFDEATIFIYLMLPHVRSEGLEGFVGMIVVDLRIAVSNAPGNNAVYND